MKKRCLILLAAVLLSGCGAEPAWETVEDVLPTEPVTAAQQLYVALPEDASTPALQEETAGELYLCDGYTVTTQLTQSGDLSGTVKSICGLDSEQLQLIRTKHGAAERYDFVWTAAGEDGLQLGRACILDDGAYHYIVSTMAPEENGKALREAWNALFASCMLTGPEATLNTGS